MAPPNLDFRALLTRLRDAQVEFVIVGGVGAALHGVPIVTFDLDIVPAQDEANLDRLHTALLSLRAIFRDPAGRKISPARDDLSRAGHLLLQTDHGPMDVLGTVGAGRRYEDLYSKSADIDVGGGLRVRVVDLDELIALKRAAGRDKDRAALPVLERTLEQKRERGRQ